MLRAILKTLAYADVFNYPLTQSEIHRFLISSKKSPRSLISKTLKGVPKTSNYYHLKSRSHLAKLRQNRARWSQAKFKIAQRVGEALKIIPWINMVSVTGTLAMNNAQKHDDIDLFIITAPNRLWLTRLFVVPFISIIANRRHPQQKPPNNSICLNLWLSDKSLKVPKTEQNLYTAHEVAQIKKIWDRGDTYKKFLSSNNWLNKFLPNITIPKSNFSTNKSNKSILYTLYNILNTISFRLQHWYMKPKITREKVSLHAAFFHPNNTRKIVFQKYFTRLKKLNLKP